MDPVERWITAHVPEILPDDVRDAYDMVILAINRYVSDKDDRESRLFSVEATFNVKKFKSLFYIDTEIFFDPIDRVQERIVEIYKNPNERMLRFLRNELSYAVDYPLRKNRVKNMLDEYVKNFDIPEPEQHWHFVTIGFDDKTITIPKIRKVIEDIQRQSFYKLESYVVEKHRKDDSGKIYIHHHIHLLIYCDLSPSKVAEKMFKWASIKKSVSGVNFIDVVDFRKAKKLRKSCDIETYRKYIKGDKTNSKLECIKLDEEWRLLNNI